MSQTRVVHINDNIEGAVYIGRANGRKGLKASKWANPHKISDVRHGPNEIIGRERALLQYTDDLFWGPKRYLLAELPELRGRALACWCRHDGVPMTNGVTDEGPDNRCHGDLLVSYLDQWIDEELRAKAWDDDDAD